VKETKETTVKEAAAVKETVAATKEVVKAEEESVKTESEDPAKASPPPPNQRQRRSTGGKTSAAAAANNKDTEGASAETEEKIKAILEQAKQEEEAQKVKLTQQIAAAKESAQQQQQQQQQQHQEEVSSKSSIVATPIAVTTQGPHPIPIPVSSLRPQLSSPSNRVPSSPSVSLTVAASTGAVRMANSHLPVTVVQQQQQPSVTVIPMGPSGPSHPTVLTQRLPQATHLSIRPPTAIPVSAAMPHSPRPPVPLSVTVNSSVSVSSTPTGVTVSAVQLPTQPIPPAEIRTTKQVLLETNAATTNAASTATTSAAPPQPQQVTATIHKVQVPTSSPRSAATTVAVTKAPTSINLPTQPVPMAIPVSTAAALSSMLPNQPLPLTAAMRGGLAPHVITATAPVATPRLPQHPLPPRVPVDSAVISTELKRKEAAEALLKQQQQPQQQQQQSPQQPQQIPTQPPSAQQQQQQQQPQHQHIIKSRDLGVAAVALAHEEKPEKPQQQILFGQVAATPEQLAMLRLQEDPEFRAFYDMFISRGHPQHLAQSLSLKALQEQRLKRQDGPERVQPAAGRPGSVPPALLEQYAPGLEVLRRQTASPVALLQQQQQQPPPAHNTRPGGIYAATTGRGLPPPDESPYSQAPDVHRLTPSAINAVTAYPPQRASPIHVTAAPRPTPEFFFPQLKPYPVVWQGLLGLKSDTASVQFFYVAGSKDLARASLPAPVDAAIVPTLRIGQRMRLEETQLEGVTNKMCEPREHCILLALPAGETQADVDAQSRGLRSNFITYLQLKSAAGIVNVTGAEDNASYIVHVFPACDFANRTMSTIAPDLLDQVAEVEHMVIIITTTT
jgi:hypothetical protein